MSARDSMSKHLTPSTNCETWDGLHGTTRETRDCLLTTDIVDAKDGVTDLTTNGNNHAVQKRKETQNPGYTVHREIQARAGYTDDNKEQLLS